jgi:3-methyladenine DNA glycosylase AlkD
MKFIFREMIKEVLMTLNEVLEELETLATPRMKKQYLSQGAKEPLFGVTSGALKPLGKKLKNNQEMAELLYQTGNYDAMYLAGMIADVNKMTKADFHRWIESAYFYMISDFIVAVTLSETDFAQEVADEFIASNDDLVMSAGWSTYEWLLGSRKDHEFEPGKIQGMLKKIETDIEEVPVNTRNAMRRFVIAVGVSFIPCHQEALDTANRIYPYLKTFDNKRAGSDPVIAILKEVDKGRIGFKRRYVRC